MRQVSPRLLEPAVDFVIVHKLDRLARDRADDVAILLGYPQSRRNSGVGIGADRRITAGTLMHGIVASFAEFYSKNLSAEARKGLEEKVRRGGTPDRRLSLLERHAENRGHRRQECHHRRFEGAAYSMGFPGVRDR